jgi:4,5-DOPA dioxygenase extradiol
MLFVGHGSPMNAIEDNAYRRGWAEAAARIPRPRAVLCISAHWLTTGTQFTGASQPETIHDFGGFPAELYAVNYPAPGDPGLARRGADLLHEFGASIDSERGLDHGCWEVLVAMYPEADIPVVQLSLDMLQPAAWHVSLARRLAPLRNEGVLVIASGNIVHNLRRIEFDRRDGEDWAAGFDARVREHITKGDLATLAEFATLPDAALAVPTPDHFLPLLYVLALRDAHDEVGFFNVATVYGSISMTCVEITPRA